MTCRHDLGLSASAIAHSGNDHPHDPADLRRCVNLCRDRGIDDEALRKRMTGRSPEWDALLPHWGELRGLLEDEIANRKDGCAPATYRRMRDLLEGSDESAAA